MKQGKQEFDFGLYYNQTEKTCQECNGRIPQKTGSITFFVCMATFPYGTNATYAFHKECFFRRVSSLKGACNGR